MKQTLCVIIGLLFLACRQQKQLIVTPAPPIKPSIKGSWKEISKDMPGVKNAYYRWINFDDSMCTGNMVANNSYYINHDTLFIKRDPQYKYSINLELPILKLTTDSLVLLCRYYDYFNNNRMALAKITQQNTIKPTAIYFSSGNFGKAPRMYLEIDSNRTFKFLGREFIKPTGGFHGKISDADYAAILTLINNLPVSTLKEFYPLVGFEPPNWQIKIKWAIFLRSGLKW